MQILISLQDKIHPCNWTLLEDIQHINPHNIDEDDTLNLSFCIICETTDGSLYWECKVKDDEGIIHIPFRIHPDGMVALLLKPICRSDEELLSLREYFSDESICEQTTFSTSKSFHHYRYSSKVDASTVWVVEVHNSVYITFYIDASGVSLIDKYLRSLGYALHLAERFIKGHK